jgi:osmotically-inducible protein OsmY
MKKTSMNKIVTLMILGLVTCLGTLSLVGLTGCTSEQTTQSTGQHMDDRATSSRVRSALSTNPEYKFDLVNVVTFKGEVQLSGFVNAKAQKSTAGDIAKNVEGVKQVANNITVKE